MNQPLTAAAREWVQRAVGAFQAQQYEAAVAAATEALKLTGQRPDLLNLKAMAQLESGRPFDAEQTIREALRLAPSDAHINANASSIYSRLTQHRDAVRHARAASRAEPANPKLMYQWAWVNREAGKPDDALKVLERLLREHPDFTDAWHLRGVIRSAQGDAEAAIADLREVLQRHPEHGKAWYALARAERNPEQLQLLVPELERVRDTAPAAEARSSAAFALADIARREKDHDRAFHLYQEANAIQAAAHPFDIDRLEQAVDAVLADSEAAVRSAARENRLGEPLVFIFGMPRSGTSLTEQVLAAHPDVLACGELAGMEIIEKNWFQGGRHPYRMEGSAALSEQDLQAARQRYLGGLPDGWQQSARVTDKAPMNFLRVGQIHRLFPAARLVLCQRHPLDTLLSNWFQNFQSGLNFSFDLDHLVRLTIAHQRITGHWRSLLGERIYLQRYDRYVQDPDAGARQLADAVGIEMDPAMLAPHRAKHSVATASNWQVRRPVYTTSLGYWQHYQSFLGPQIEALQQAGILNDALEPIWPG